MNSSGKGGHKVHQQAFTYQQVTGKLLFRPHCRTPASHDSITYGYGLFCIRLRFAIHTVTTGAVTVCKEVHYSIKKNLCTVMVSMVTVCKSEEEKGSQNKNKISIQTKV